MATRAVLLASFKALNAIRAMVLAAGLAAMTAVAASWLMRLVTGGSRLGWATPVQIFAMEMAAAFLIAALGMATFMPSASAASRAEPGVRRVSPVVQLMLAALVAVALLQIGALSTWWAEDRVLLTRAMGGDESGLRLIPATVLFSLPTVAALALVTFVLTSIVGMLVRAELVFAVLTACLCLQAGLVVGEQFLLHSMASLGTTVLNSIAGSRDTDAAAQVTDWLARHDAAAAGLCRRLMWIVGGYTLSTAIA